MLLSIQHLTSYRYSQPVRFLNHRLLIRPLEGHDVQLRSSSLLITPPHRIRWIHDVFDNSIALVDFQEPSDQLRIESNVTVEQYNTNPFDFVLEPSALELPIQYQLSDQANVQPYLIRQFPQDEPALQNWTRPFLNVNARAQTLDFLLALSKSVPLYFTYIRRDEPGVQSPALTLQLRSGSCRDFALLLMEAARYFGLAARFVSGYLCLTDSALAQAAAGATHAWTEIYLPGAGWKGFDPTCGVLAADSHVRVAVARDPAQASPVSGGFIGNPAAYKGMNVTVTTQIVTHPQSQSQSQSNPRP